MAKKLFSIDKKNNVLFKNTIMLYILRFSTYFFGFITVPYQTRILGPDIYGKVSAAMALMIYFQLFIDFGFMLSATQDVANHSEDKDAVARIYSSVQYAKFVFIGISFLLLGLICYYIPLYRKDYIFYFVYLIGTVFNGLMPDFVYRGLQEMGPVTFRVVLSRLVFTIFVFILLKTPEDYMIVPILSAAGNLIALVWSIFYLYSVYGISISKVSLAEVKKNLLASSGFFLSRVAGTLYTNSSILILGHIAPFSQGNYGVANKLITTGQSALTPISDSVYPHMAKNKDLKILKRILLLTMPIITLGCIIAFIFAEPLCIFIFGKEYGGAGAMLRGMLPAAVLTLPDYLFGFPAMAALGIIEHANYSIYFTSTLHVVNVIILYSTGNLNAVNLAWLMSVAVAAETLYRLYFVRKYWKIRLAEQK